MKRVLGRRSVSLCEAAVLVAAFVAAPPCAAGGAPVEFPVIPRLAAALPEPADEAPSQSSTEGPEAADSLAVPCSPSGEPSAPAGDRGEAEPVTISVKNIEIKDLLEMFSRSRGLNIVCGEEVSGKVSLELHGVPFEKALQAAAAMVGCQAVKLDNIYYVNKIFGNEENTIRKVQAFRLDYAAPEEIEGVVRELLSETGKVTSYVPLRSVVVDDRPDVVERVETIVRNLDVPPRQVLIEARIMEARLSRDMHYGVDWSLLFSPGKGHGEIAVEGFTRPSDMSGEGLFMSWGKGDFVAAIEALEGVEELNTLAAPKLLAVDGTEAEIIIGGELGFRVVTTVENTIMQSVEFLQTGTQLKITPIIASDGNILMKVHPELSNGVIQEDLPSKTTAEVTTDVLIKDGHTLFIGGLIRERREDVLKGIPLLKRIPVLGALFGRTVHSREKTELVTLITPRIVQPTEQIDYR